MKILIARFKGGIGNQFFFYHFSKNIIQSLNISKVLYISSHNSSLYLRYNIKNRIENFYNIKVYNTNLINSIFDLFNIIQDWNFKSKSKIKNIIIKIFRKFLTSYLQNSTGFIIFLKESNFNILKNFNRKNFIIFLDGYWIAQHFLNLNTLPFKFEKEIKISEKNIVYFKNIISTNSVSIHIRGNQYLNQYKDEYANVSLSYYLNAIKKINSFFDDCCFFIFSDDLNYASKFKLEFLKEMPKVNFYLIENDGPDYEHFYMMSKCKHNIIINSTFSWWAAVFNENPQKVVIAPKKWSGIKIVNEYYDNLPLKNWILLEN